MNKKPNLKWNENFAVLWTFDMSLRFHHKCFTGQKKSNKGHHVTGSLWYKNNIHRLGRVFNKLLHLQVKVVNRPYKQAVMKAPIYEWRRCNTTF